MFRSLCNLDKRVFISFVLGAVIANLCLYILSEWVYSPEIFAAFGTIIQTIIAGVAVAALLFPGEFEKIKEMQLMKNKLDMEFKYTIQDLKANLDADIANLQAHIEDLPETKRGERYPAETEIKSQIEKSLVVQPSLDEAKSLFEDAKKHEVSIPTNIIKLYRYFEHTSHRKDESIIQAFGKTYVFKDGGRQRNPGTNHLIKDELEDFALRKRKNAERLENYLSHLN